MEQFFITNLTIKSVRHLKDIFIPLSGEKIKHLILTGKNGSGKTSVVEALAGYLDNAFTDQHFKLREQWLQTAKRKRDMAVQNMKDEGEILKLEADVCANEEVFQRSRKGLKIQFNRDDAGISALAEEYHYVLAYYRADRVFQAEQPRHVEKIRLKDYYGLHEFPRNEFVKYLLDLKMTEALARNNKKTEKADEIGAWFEKLEQLLKQIFEDETIKLIFDEDTFEFHISQQGKKPFDFNTLSSGYQAVLDIVLDIMMRMQHQTQHSFNLFGFNSPQLAA